MAKRSVLTYIDDLDGTEIGPGLGETVRFAIDGRAYEIDLTNSNAVELRDKFLPFVLAGRRLPVKRARRRSK